MRDSKKNQRKQAYTGGYLKQKKTQPGFVPSAPFFVLGYTCTSKSFTTFAYTGYSTPRIYTNAQWLPLHLCKEGSKPL